MFLLERKRESLREQKVYLLDPYWLYNLNRYSTLFTNQRVSLGVYIIKIDRVLSKILVNPGNKIIHNFLYK